MPKTIRDFFEALNRSRCNYVVLRDQQDLPERWLDREKPIVMLVDNVEDFMMFGGVTRVNTAYSCYTVITVAGQEVRQMLEVYPKGAGLFPESFESQLMNKWELAGGLVKVPQQPYATYSLMYLMLYRDKLAVPTDCRMAFETFLRDRLGMNSTAALARNAKVRKLRPRSVTP